MKNTTATNSFRSYLLDRISELTKSHTRYKEEEGSTEEEPHKTGLNSTAACLWDMKAEFERALEVFDMEFGSQEKPYKIIQIYFTKYATPKIEIQIGEASTTFELEKFANEPGEDTLNRLIARADKFYEFHLQEENALIEAEHELDRQMRDFEEKAEKNIRELYNLGEPLPHNPSLTEEERIKNIWAPGAPTDASIGGIEKFEFLRPTNFSNETAL